MCFWTRRGLSYIDLYVLAIARLGSFDLRQESSSDTAGADLATSYVDLLEQQMHAPGFHAFYELSQVSETFDLLLAVNFPDVPSGSLQALAKRYGATLQRQVPVGRMSGGVNKRLVRQFRMPAFPLVLVTTEPCSDGTLSRLCSVCCSPILCATFVCRAELVLQCGVVAPLLAEREIYLWWWPR